LLSLISAFGSGLYLYTVKHRTGVIDRQIGQAIQATAEAQRQTGLLRAEWSSLNDPDRLQHLAARYLSLAPTASTQFAQAPTLPDRIRQAVEAPAPAPAPLTLAPLTLAPAPTPAPASSPGDTGADVAAAPGPAIIADAAATPPAPHRAPLHPPSLAPHPRPDHAPLLTVAQKLLPTQRHVTVARADPPRPPASPYHHIGQARSDPPHDLALPQGTALPLAAPAIPADVGAMVRNAMARPAPPHPLPPVIAARPSYPSVARYQPPGWAPYGSPYGTPYAAMPSPRPTLPPPVPLEPEYQ